MMRNYMWIWICFVSVVCFPANDEIPIEGTVADGWEFVRDLFKENFIEKRDLGGSISVYHQGKLVVDLSAGWFDQSMNKFYDRDTLQLVFSTTKGIVAIAVALAVEKGLLDYSELVSTYWPEYAQNGKENTTVADIVSHRAGLPLNPSLSEYLLNWTAMIEFLETEKPLWNPGNAHSYHALTYGYLAGELIHRVDPKKRTIGQFIRDEIVNPLNVQFYVGLPKEEEYRVSPLTFDSNTLEILNETEQAVYLYFNDPLVHQAQIPAANGITNARSLAKIYAALITNLENNEKPLLNRNILEQAIQSNTPHNELDILTNSSSTFAMGFLLFDKIFPFFNSTVFGHPGAGGSIALAIPSKNLSFAYVMNQLDFSSNDQIYPRFYRILKKISMKIDNLD